MRKISIPINFASVTEETKGIYLDILKKCKAERVFFCCLDYIYEPTCMFYTNKEAVRNNISFFQENGYEVGIWVNSFGHGGVLVGADGIKSGDYTPIEGIDGKTMGHAFCPSDERFVADYTDAIKCIASFNPDLIMLDDDFRFNWRYFGWGYYMGCFCPKHLKRFYELVGEEVPREKIEELAFTGGKNKYRDAYYDMIAEGLLGFAKHLRKAVDEINPNIRLGASFSSEGWDTGGTVIMDIARAFAGNTQPFARIAGAPYWNSNIIPVVEAARMQYVWRKGSDVEMFSEGDTYPRPRYNVSSKVLELFDFLLLADGGADGILAYLVDYNQLPDYETGYVARFVRNAPIREGIAEIFQNKTPIGVNVFNVIHKVRNYSLPQNLIKGISQRLEELQLYSPGQDLLSANTIPTVFNEKDSAYPVLVFGENAKYIDLDQLKMGAIVDVKAANILQSRGVDVGLLSSAEKSFSRELYCNVNDYIPDIAHSDTQNITVKNSAIVESVFLPDNTPASYRYENANGEKFFVMAFQYESMYGYNANYLKNYYRQAQIQAAIEWMCGKKLPATSTKNPNLYVLASKGADGALAVALANIHLDDVYDAEIALDENYSSIRFICGEGELQGEKIRIPYLQTYGFIAFELRK